MTEDQENQNEGENNIKKEESSKDQDDLDVYLSDMKNLETDFSDLDELDLEELQEMQDAIAKVKEMEDFPTEKLIEEPISKEFEDLETNDQSTEREEYLTQKEAMMNDFSDIENIDFEELQEMQKAIETVKHEEELTPETQFPSSSEIYSDLEERIKEELLERKQEIKKEIITPEKFIERIKKKRDKIWYHVLHYLVYQAEGYIASKELLYEMLKEVTSKSPIDPIPENQFYFGLGYILRLSLNEKQVVKYLRGGKFKINIGIKGISDILEEVGDPITTRPILKEEEKRKMYKEFLNDDFFDQI